MSRRTTPATAFADTHPTPSSGAHAPPIGRYVADFACEPLRLVIEVDGGVHRLDDVAVGDHVRQVDLEEAGWTVIRFTNDAALANPHQIVTAIHAYARLIRS